MLEMANTEAEKTVMNEVIIKRARSRAGKNLTANRLQVPGGSPVEVHYPLPARIPTGFPKRRQPFGRFGVPPVDRDLAAGPEGGMVRAVDSRSLALVLIAFSVVIATTGVVAEAGQPVTVQAAQSAFNDAYRQEDWPRAIAVGLDLAQMLPDNALVKYNLACAYALSGDPDSALHWLGRAAASGFTQLSHFDADTDLDSVRDRPGFPSVRAAVAENENRHRKEIEIRASTSPLLIVASPDHDRKLPAPLIIAFHGYGDRAANYPRFWSGPAGEYGAILAVPQGLQPVGDGFGWGNVDEADVIFQRALKEVGREYAVDPERVVLTGFSQGGFIALALGLRYPDRLVGVIPMAGPYIPEVDAPPPARAGDPRYYFIVGSRDRAVSDVRRAAKDYESAGFDVKLRIVQSTGHNFPQDSARELDAALKWVLQE
jgi:predicted esterase